MNSKNSADSPAQAIIEPPAPWVSVVIPIRKCSATVGRSLDALLKQKLPAPCEIILVRNGYDDEKDDSMDIIRAHPLCSTWACRELHGPGKGLGGSYNLGWRAARSERVVFMHSDCYPVDDDALMRMVDCLKDPEVLAVQPLVGIPKDDWNNMSFWDRVTQAQFRYAKPEHGLGGKFDLFRRSALERLGGYDEAWFFSAAEDADIHERLCRIGKTACSHVLVIHGHKHPPATRFQAILRKHAQIGEGSGALLRKYFFSFDFWRRAHVIVALNFMKLALTIGIFIPPVTLYAAVLMLALSVYYARWAFFTRDWRVVLLPVAVPLMMAVFALSMVRAFILRRQSFDYMNRRR